ncbi:glycosyltransferase family 32 protein [Aspergillus lucknowensis]|uniref:Nucleotide-diphospho-sugar transferase n=1 Tax=Aspergillus lucknowensis TaxID=176173 RepID=A0ABR4LX93_9EURO
MIPSLGSVTLSRRARQLLGGCLTTLILLSFSFIDNLNGAHGGLITQPRQGNNAKWPLFPKKIWQLWKTDPLAFEERDLRMARSWTSKNPAYRYEVLTDQHDIHYVETHFGPQGFNRPDIIEVYSALNARIIKADLLRYLVMYVEGGVYADIDVEALKPLDRFIPERYDEHEVDMIIGVEIDEPTFRDHPILGQKSMSFCQWTFMCKPRLPVMLRLTENIISWLHGLSERQRKPISELEMDFDDVITGTGPSAFTSAVLEEMSLAAGHEVTWDTFHDMAESKLVGGFLVLTVEAFAAGQGHSDSGNHEARAALVKHHYHASGWPNKHPRYKHPIYGEVEKCNWNKECVREWDEHTAAFAALSPEEQEKEIALKKAADDEEERQRAAQEAEENAAAELAAAVNRNDIGGLGLG